MQFVLKLLSILSLIFINASCKPPVPGDINLVPDQPNRSPDYWCKWDAQNYATDTLSVKHTLALSDHSVTAAYLSERNVFGENGWSDAMPAILKQDLILLFYLKAI